MKEVELYIPHRAPFLFVDTVDVVDEMHYAGTFRFDPEWPVFRGHFPDFPVVPGVLLVESMAQCGGAGVTKAGVIRTNLVILLASVNSAKFRRMVRPGDMVAYEIETVKVSHRMLRQRGKVLVEGKVAAEADWVCMVSENSHETASAAVEK